MKSYKEAYEELRRIAETIYRHGESSFDHNELQMALYEEERQPDPTDHIRIEVYQQDWVPGFAGFLDDFSLAENAKAHVVLNVGSLLAVKAAGNCTQEELPYFIVESLLHEFVHVLESWAKVEFDEERVVALTDKYMAYVKERNLL